MMLLFKTGIIYPNFLFKGLKMMFHSEIQTFCNMFTAYIYVSFRYYRTRKL
ncbi:hypothetical protein ERO13_D09G158250v2 [Gossypium hirsutum]|nr:hypothetical protein ERO13_D09G158250v2 [Gossypium hirsutum]